MAAPLAAYGILYLFHILGKRWNVPILESIYSAKGEVKFNYLYSILGSVTPKNLSNGLKDLANAGLIEKRVTNEGSVAHTSYMITKKGLSVIRMLHSNSDMAFARL